MTRSILLPVVAGAAMALTACGDAQVDPMGPAGPGPQLAKPPASTTYPAQVTIVAGDLIDDGRGAYRDGQCGVFAKWTESDAGPSFNFVPAGTSIPSAQVATCGGTTPRAVTLHLHTKHLSDSPHVDDANSPAGSGVFLMNQFATGAGGGTKINAPPACFLVSRNGRVTGRGLRFDADGYAGSSDLIRENLGNGFWRIHSPEGALAWCEDNSGISLWHVSVDLQVQVLN